MITSTYVLLDIYNIDHDKRAISVYKVGHRSDIERLFSKGNKST